MSRLLLRVDWSGQRECSKCRGLYRDLLGGEFLVKWFELVGFMVLVGRVPFLGD